MLVEAYKDGDRYILPISGKDQKIKVMLDEDKYQIDILSLVTTNNAKELSKDEFRDAYGEELYRKYLMLDEKTMEKDWEMLIVTHEDTAIEDNELMGQAILNWDKD